MIDDDYKNELDRYFTLWRYCIAMYENWSKAYGFSCNETLVINYIAQNKRCTQKLISDNLQISKQTVNMILKRFEKDDFVTLTINDMDKRSKFLTLTEKGRKCSEELMSDLMKIELNAVKNMGIPKFKLLNDYQEEYIKLFNKFSDNN